MRTRLDSTTLTLTLSTRQDQANLSKILLTRSLTLSDAATDHLIMVNIWLVAILLTLDEIVIAAYKFLFVGWGNDLPIIWAAALDLFTWRSQCSNAK